MEEEKRAKQLIPVRVAPATSFLFFFSFLLDFDFTHPARSICCAFVVGLPIKVARVLSLQGLFHSVLLDCSRTFVSCGWLQVQVIAIDTGCAPWRRRW